MTPAIIIKTPYFEQICKLPVYVKTLTDIFIQIRITLTVKHLQQYLKSHNFLNVPFTTPTGSQLWSVEIIVLLQTK